MPKQIISDIAGELLETGKQTGKQVAKLPGEIVKEGAQQTGVKPKTEKDIAGEGKIQEMKQSDEAEKRKGIAVQKRQLMEEMQKAPSPEPSVRQRQERARQEEMALLEEGKKKELPLLPQITKAKKGLRSLGRKARKIEIKTGPSG